MKMRSVIFFICKSENGEDMLGELLVSSIGSTFMSRNTRDGRDGSTLTRWGNILLCMNAFLDRLDTFTAVLKEAKKKVPLDKNDVTAMTEIISILQPVFRVVEMSKVRSAGMVPLLMIEMVNLRMGVLNTTSELLITRPPSSSLERMNTHSDTPSDTSNKARRLHCSSDIHTGVTDAPHTHPTHHAQPAHPTHPAHHAQPVSVPHCTLSPAAAVLREGLLAALTAQGHTLHRFVLFPL
jgi:hypothetical protein